jgi:beta-lactamase superfamily II metal-dependent hydrolase
MSVYRIDMLPAREGDCLWIEYGDPARPRRILVDGGRRSAYATLKRRFAALPLDQREFELLVLSHVDADHIEGLLKLVADPDLPVRFKDVWFNGRRHLDRLQDFGALQGEAFTQGIAAKGWQWNAAFNGASVVIPDRGMLPVKKLADGMRLTVLSPTWQKLEKLSPVWDEELDKAGMGLSPPAPDTDPPGLESFGALTIEDVEDAAAARFKSDDSAANGSSICVLAEFDGRRAVLTGDAHADVVAASLARLGGASGGAVSLDAFKLSHHGSRGTHSVDLMRQIRCRRFLVSSDGSRHKHPHVESIARTLRNSGGGIELVCNYQSPQTSAWDQAALKAYYGYEMAFPIGGEPGLARVAL